LPGKHVALEVLWDGDTQGWWLRIELVTETKSKSGWWSWTRTEPEYSRTALLDTLRYGGDIRLFQGKVPPWPEAIVAQRAGPKVAQALGLDLYFPSPDDPDDDCPGWSDRARAVRCDVCGKPIVRQGLASRCSPCELREERRLKILTDAPPSLNMIVCAREGGDKPDAISFSLGSGSGPGIEEQLSIVLRDRAPAIQLSAAVDTTLDPAEVARIRAWCEASIDARLGAYQPDERFPLRVAHPRVIRWRGAERTIRMAFDQPGWELAELLGWHAFLDADAGRVHLFGNAGVTARDASVLATLRAGAHTGDDLRAAYPYLPPEALARTLRKLEEGRFLVREGEGVRLLFKGQMVS
jgi:hypothetical protein